MALNAHLSGLLILLVTGLAPGIRDSLRAQDPGPRPLELKEVFKLFQIQFNKSYSNPAEHARRLDIFVHNLAMAQRLQEEDLGTAEFGVTPFSDLTEEEFGQLYGNWRAAKKDLRVGRKGKCNCCWAIAAAGNIEALWNIRFKQSVEVSVQELLDCGRCGDGCLGGYVWDAFITVLNYSEYLALLDNCRSREHPGTECPSLSPGGLASEKDYRFRGRANIHRCLAPFYKKVAWIQDYVMLPRNEHTMARYVATQGPITVLINQMLLQHYRQGIIRATPSTCDPWLVNHYVLLVGFGKEEEKKGSEKDLSQSNHLPRHSTPYWILKNSWGAHWGEQGYFRLHQGSNTCGITRSPLTACIGDPAEKQQVSCPL
ncbi:cathepsin W isoform X3 [Heterocephalus glaber]|uniref:Cathepsin W isoform X3 n=1 Tax=Heterocephalus glaber TaxID=10181 RepID=A0AAX6R0P6_HETGA|nr:cathepsin W isoform X3 [Heterocephalus glaber]